MQQMAATMPMPTARGGNEEARTSIPAPNYSDAVLQEHPVQLALSADAFMAVGVLDSCSTCANFGESPLLPSGTSMP